MADTKIVGNNGEDYAAAYLEAAGYKIKERQFRCKIGEIDIIAEKDEEIVFVEVKTRRSGKYGAPALAVNYYKRRKIINTAFLYVQNKGLEDKNFRFDVLEVYADRDGAWAVRAIENAFEVD